MVVLCVRNRVFSITQRYAVLFIIAVCFFVSGAHASVVIDEIAVTAARNKNRVMQSATILDKQSINVRHPSVFTDVFKSLPGIGLRTNSRGEAVLRVRGAEERQSQVFLNGAPLSVPWDGRTDLSLLPSGILDSVRINKSVAPLEYGANAVFGVVDIITKKAGPTVTLEGRAEIGTLGKYLLDGTAVIPFGASSLVFSVSKRHQDAEPVANRAILPFDTLLGKGRTNTDQTATSFFSSIQHDQDWGGIQAYVLHVNAEKGIAAAAHLNPLQEAPRYWRYPEWHLTQLSMNADIAVNDKVAIQTTMWRQWFGQAINVYEDSRYQKVHERQDDDDNTYGGRFVISSVLGEMTLHLHTSLQHSQHNQVDVGLLGASNIQEEVFSQNLVSFGGEVDLPVSPTLKLSMGATYDKATTPLTGGRGRQPSLDDWAGNITLQWKPQSDWVVAASVGRRNRFPTMRELYGTALGRFLINLDLTPELVTSADVNIGWSSADGRLQGSITPWYTNIKNTISRQVIILNGDHFQRRYNLQGSYGYGIEGAFEWRITKWLNVGPGFSWQHLKAKLESTGMRPVLFQRPEWQGFLKASLSLTEKFNVRAEVSHTGNAKDQNEDGTIVNLGSSTEINLRASYKVQKRWEIYSAIDNVANAVVLPQLGLPLPGRSIKIGVIFRGS